MKIPVLVSFLSMLSCCLYAAESIEAQFKALKDDLRLELEKTQPDSSSTSSSLKQLSVAHGMTLLGVKDLSSVSKILGHRDSAAMQSLEWLEAFSSNAKIRESSRVIVEALRAEQEKYVEEVNQKGDKLLKRSLEKTLSAQTPQELDPLLSELAEITKEFNQHAFLLRSSDSEGSGNGVRMMSEFIIMVQDYMIKALKAPTPLKYEEVYQRLNGVFNAAQGNLFYRFMPRSEILTKLLDLSSRIAELNAENAPGPVQRSRGFSQKPVSTDGSDVAAARSSLLARQAVDMEKINQVLEKLKNPEDLDSVLEELEKFPTSTTTRDGQNLEQFRNVLFQFRKLKADLDSGDLDVARLPENQRFSDMKMLKSIDQLRLGFERLIVQRCIEPPKDLVLQETEPVGKFMRRAIEYSISHEDWELMIRIFTTANNLRMVGVASGEDLNLARCLRSAKYHETANVVENAVNYYLMALKNSSRFVPLDLIKNKLDKLKKQEPEAYEKGVKQSQTTREPVFMRNVPFDPSQPGVMRPVIPGQPLMDDRIDPRVRRLDR